MAALDRAFVKVFSFRGKLNRKGFALFFVTCFVAVVASNAIGFVIDEMIIYDGLSEGWILLPLAGLLAALIAYLSAIIRRVRDTGFGVVFTVLCIISSIVLPVAGLLVAVFLISQPHSDAEGTFAQKLKPTLIILACVAVAFALFAWGGVFFTASGCTLPIDLVIVDTCMFGSLVASMGASIVLTLVIGVPLALLALFLRSMRT